LIEQILLLSAGAINIADIGAAFLGEIPSYNGLGSLFAFEPDPGEAERLRQYIGTTGRVFQEAVGDGKNHTLYLCGYGMTSIFEPDPDALGFFNTFPILGRVHSTIPISTRRLDDIIEVRRIDFLKMDVQGSELAVLQHGRQKLSKCVAIQLEISFVTLYKKQPPFGELDIELRSQGFIPHRFMDVKLWSISPTIRNNTPQMPFNQLLEGDIVYIRDIIHKSTLTDLQIKKLAAIAHFALNSPDLAARCIIDLQKRNAVPEDSVQKYLQTIR
jgi:FkbM family methyltransferase